jgi:hypothetical protein
LDRQRVNLLFQRRGQYVTPILVISTRLQPQLLSKIMYAFLISITAAMCPPCYRAIISTTLIMHHPFIISLSMESLCRESHQLLRNSLIAAILRVMTKGVPILGDLYKTRNSKFQFFFISFKTAFLTFVFRLISDVFFFK